MNAAPKTRRTTRAASANRAPRRRAPTQRPASNTGALLTWGAFAFLGLVVAAGVAAILADDVPFEDRQIRDMRLRLRALAASGTSDAVDTLRRQFNDLQSDVQKRLAHLR